MWNLSRVVTIQHKPIKIFLSKKTKSIITKWRDLKIFRKFLNLLKRSAFGISIIQLEISVLSIRLGYWLKVFSNSVKWNWNARNVKHCLTTDCVELRFLCNAESEIIWIVDRTCSCLAFGMRHNNIFALISPKEKMRKKMMYIVVDRDKRKERESPYLS